MTEVELSILHDCGYSVGGGAFDVKVIGGVCGGWVRILVREKDGDRAPSCEDELGWWLPIFEVHLHVLW